MSTVRFGAGPLRASTAAGKANKGTQRRAAWFARGAHYSDVFPVARERSLQARRTRLLILAGLATGVAAALTPWSLAETVIERRLAARLSAQLGAEITGGRDGVFALLPTPRIAVNDLTIRVKGGHEAKVPRLRADIALLPLLAGRVEFNHVAASAPQITVATQGGDWSLMALLASPELAALPGHPRLSITGGGSLFIREGGHIATIVRDITLDAEARRGGQPLVATAAGTWRGERVSAAFASNSPERAVLPTLKVSSDMGNLDFTALRRPSSATPAGALEGQFTFSSRSVARLASWVSPGATIGSLIGPTEIAGRMHLSPDKADIRSASVTLGADTLEGAFSWLRRETGWQLSGTFAGRSLDIARPGAGVDLGPLTPADQHNPQLPSGPLLAHDMDVRLSLQRLRIAGLTLTDVAAQLMGGENRLDLSIANAGLYRGSARARFAIERSATGLDMRSTLTAERVDLALLSGDILEGRRLTGVGAAQAQLEAGGRDASDLVQTLQGRVQVTARNGDFAGTNLTDTMRRIDRQPLAAARDWRGGRTSFDQMTLGGTVRDGVLELAESGGSGPAYRLTLGGSVSLPERQMRLTGAVHSATTPTVAPFEIVGPLSSPSVQINARGLIERSNAAQPLLQGRAN